MDLAEVRRLVIVAMFSDDMLFNQLVLKGGNALNLIYGIGTRSSLDVDLSLEGDFANPDESGHRILQALVDRFAEAGLTVFDQTFSKRPARQDAGEEKWGGYEVEFKLTETEKFKLQKDGMDKVR